MIVNTLVVSKHRYGRQGCQRPRSVSAYRTLYVINMVFGNSAINAELPGVYYKIKTSQNREMGKIKGLSEMGWRLSLTSSDSVHHPMMQWHCLTLSTDINSNWLLNVTVRQIWFQSPEITHNTCFCSSMCWKTLHI